MTAQVGELPVADRRPGFACAVDTEVGVVRRIAGRAASHGYGSLWVNTDDRHPDGLDTLAEMHAIDPQLDLGVGVMALHRIEPEQIVARVRASGIPLERLRLGIGSGTAPTPVERPLGRVRAALAELRSELPGVTLVVAALGPAMCRLGGELADQVLLNWMPPSGVRAARQEIDRGATRRTGSPPPLVLAYIRVASGPDAKTVIAREAARYRRAGTHYETNAERVGPWNGGVDLGAPSSARELAAYAASLDQLVLRGLPSGRSPEDVEELAARGSAVLRSPVARRPSE